MRQEQLLKKQIIKSAESVKRKVKTIRDMKTNKEIALDAVLKPITEPLNKLASKSADTVNKTLPFRELNPLSTLKKRKRNIQFQQRQGTIKIPKLSNAIDSLSDYSDDSKSVNLIETDCYANTERTPNDLKEISNSSDTNDGDSREFFTPELSKDSSWSMTAEPDNVPFGVRKERGKLLMGNSRVTFNEREIVIGSKSYIKTPGLLELLFKKTPNLSQITEDDKQHYKKMLLDTNAHRRDFDPNKAIKSNKGLKYTNIIRPLFIKLVKNYPSTESISEGAGLPIMKKLNKHVDYVYWDDPNELVERLKLLLASSDAGNTGVNNEIISVIEELRECGVLN